MKNSIKWIWYPGDFEVYHGMLQNFEREERGYGWPAYWYLDDCRKHVRFHRSYMLESETKFTVYSHAAGHVKIGDEKYPFGKQISCGPGICRIVIVAGMPAGVPSVYVEGKAVYSDASWQVDDFTSEPVGAGWNERYTRPEQDPSIWEYDKREVYPVSAAERAGGILFDFGTEMYAELKLHFKECFKAIHICYGESETEALDIVKCYYSQRVTAAEEHIRARAFRYVFIPEMKLGEVQVTGTELYVDMPAKANFVSDDREMNEIWTVAERTFKLCSGKFFLDGIKRDRWIWSGDAYQSYFVNQYLLFNEEINKRTIWALRGNDPIRQHINTIVDYSMYWVMGIYQHYFMTGDKEFVEAVMPKLKTMMIFLEEQLDEYGFITGREGDWIFIDWAEMDKDGAVCAEQMLLAICYKTMAEFGENAETWHEKYTHLLAQIDHFYWDDERHAYIDSFASGKRNVTRHANIFAVLFGIADDRKKEDIFQHVLLNEKIPAITTPYFKFYELEAMCILGQKEMVKGIIKDYWGGMLRQGAVTFWEEYNPEDIGAEHYEMYNDPYGKSLCHAWAGSPIYILGRYFAGLYPTKPAYEEFVVEPETDLFAKADFVLPIKDGSIKIKWDDQQLCIRTDRAGGTVRFGGREESLMPGKEWHYLLNC